MTLHRSALRLQLSNRATLDSASAGSAQLNGADARTPSASPEENKRGYFDIMPRLDTSSLASTACEEVKTPLPRTPNTLFGVLHGHAGLQNNNDDGVTEPSALSTTYLTAGDLNGATSGMITPTYGLAPHTPLPYALKDGYHTPTVDVFGSSTAMTPNFAFGRAALSRTGSRPSMGLRRTSSMFSAGMNISDDEEEEADALLQARLARRRRSLHARTGSTSSTASSMSGFDDLAPHAMLESEESEESLEDKEMQTEWTPYERDILASTYDAYIDKIARSGTPFTGVPPSQTLHAIARHLLTRHAEPIVESGQARQKWRHSLFVTKARVLAFAKARKAFEDSQLAPAHEAGNGATPRAAQDTTDVQMQPEADAALATLAKTGGVAVGHRRRLSSQRSMDFLPYQKDTNALSKLSSRLQPQEEASALDNAHISLMRSFSSSAVAPALTTAVEPTPSLLKPSGASTFTFGTGATVSAVPLGLEQIASIVTDDADTKSKVTPPRPLQRSRSSYGQTSTLPSQRGHNKKPSLSSSIKILSRADKALAEESASTYLPTPPESARKHSKLTYLDATKNRPALFLSPADPIMPQFGRPVMSNDADAAEAKRQWRANALIDSPNSDTNESSPGGRTDGSDEADEPSGNRATKRKASITPLTPQFLEPSSFRAGANPTEGGLRSPFTAEFA
ncbi:uncharacterized protein L969DRAFT_104743 [Mixia osmundae IAM 14324]|uniref:Uncharacterized protein n=1 Tax=Mixia osmundae (strain CBS 9802 / IAM 14324 / JCM 22182 / KY 12970) TaxID=764103 RepID=G7DWU1_MIXOS|nr:uncharacterized protein L969DRAFT_20545 [Mixia osmundae IAM 14324]XP_014566716.1 uncharacterized protein L969DRAFT_104743 [Mixia osmundae IAM 14324]KEI36185.1 hypothetical protein L969DRAFT_20545 [Mixia osmundae IAM 14324]KEI38153.1 hypothetical protein L969DRAFT_104743 [Mixia osmundae IAM 14324]GAA95038.1 hypothetical protein E5Q_01693 [Mixia osmundae IAM 14324]